MAMRTVLLAIMGIWGAGCIDAREPYVADPLVQIGLMECHIAGAQVVMDATFDVRLPAGQTFRVEHTTTLADTTMHTYMFFGCNEWSKAEHSGCTRLDDAQPETQSVSLHMTDNSSNTLPTSLRVDVSGVVESDEVVVQASRELVCSR